MKIQAGLDKHEIIALLAAFNYPSMYADSLVDMIVSGGYVFTNETIKSAYDRFVDEYSQLRKNNGYEFNFSTREKIFKGLDVGAYALQDHMPSIEAVKERYKELRGEKLISEFNGTSFNDYLELSKNILAINELKNRKTTADLLIELKTDVEKFIDGEKKVINTGILKLDNVLNGILPDDIVVLGAKSGTGKTFISCQVAFNAAKDGHRVLFITNEMGTLDILKRMIATQLNMPEKEIYQDPKKFVEFFEFAQKQLPLLGNLEIIYQTDFDSAIALIKLETFKKPYDIVFIDYLQLFYTPKIKEERDRLVYYCHCLKDFAREYSIPLFVVAQIPKGDTNYESFFGSASIRDMASIGLIFLKDTEIEEPYDNRKKAKIIINKGRRGESGVVYGYVDYPDPKFHDLQHSYAVLREYDF